MKSIIACICEGTAEQTIVDILLDDEKLIFTREELLDEKVIRSRSAKKFEEKYLRKGFSERIIIYRVLDSVKENFCLSKLYREKVDVINIYTTPEIEMLIIISEGKYDDYTNKKKKNMKPSEYCKSVLKFSSVKNKSFLSNYFHDSDKLVMSILDYQRLTKKNKYKTLADLLRK